MRHELGSGIGFGQKRCDLASVELFLNGNILGVRSTNKVPATCGILDVLSKIIFPAAPPLKQDLGQ